MTIDIIKADLQTLKDEVDYLIRFISDHQAEPELEAKPINRDGKKDNSHLFRLRHPEPLSLGDDVGFVQKKFFSMGKVIAELKKVIDKLKDSNEELFNAVMPKAYSLGPLIQLDSKYKETFELVNRNIQFKSDDYTAVLDFTYGLQKAIFDLEVKILQADALTLSSPTVKEAHIERRISLALQESEQTRTSLRQEIHLAKAKKGTETLRDDLLNASDDKVLDINIAKVMYLAGFDFEVLNVEEGNLDILVYHHGEKSAILIEGTTGSVPKWKVDQVVGRRQEYTELFAKLLGKQTAIYLLIVTNRKKHETERLGRIEARLNGVSIFTKKELEGLIALLAKGKLDRITILSMLKDAIPTDAA